MKQRGRKSATAVAVARPVETVPRLEVPLDLTPEQTDIWHAVAASRPADWWDSGNAHLLSQYCRHVIQARRLAQLIDAEMARPELDIRAIATLDALQNKNTMSIRALAASMRISQQSNYSARGAAGAASRHTTRARPWEDE